MTSETDIHALPYRPCVGLMVVNPAGLVWAGRRIDNAADAWQMPQGGIDPGEAPRDAALRELAEETSIPANAVALLAETRDWIPYDLPANLVAKLWKGRFRGQTQKWFLMRFTGDDSLIRIDTEEPEFSHWAWMQPDVLIDKIVPFKRATYEAVFSEFGEVLAHA